MAGDAGTKQCAILPDELPYNPAHSPPGLPAMTLRYLRLLCALVAPLLLAPKVATATTVLFDPGLHIEASAQGWVQACTPLFACNPFGLTGAGLLDLNTTVGANANSTQGGYFSELPSPNGAARHPGVPVLDRTTGFRLEFALHVISESHDLNRDDNGDLKLDRAGFSLIALSQDLFGIELAFFANRVWAYEDATPTPGNAFTQAEFAGFDSSAGLLDYALTISGNSYALRQDGNLLLSGALRKYAPSGRNALIDPYDNPSFLFFGDDTSAAQTHAQIGRIAIASVPLPASIALLVPPLLLLRRRR